MGKPKRFPYDEVYHRKGIRWEETTHTMGKVLIRIYQVPTMQLVLLSLPRNMDNWWEDPCVSRRMRFVNFFLWNNVEKRSTKATPNIERTSILYIYREYLFCLQSNGNDSFLEKCINFVEQRLKFSHFEGSIMPEQGTLETHVVWCIKSRIHLFMYLSPIASFFK